MVESIEFYDEDTGGPIDTLRGKEANWLVYHSGLIQMLLENQPNARHLRVPVSMPNDRIQTFRKIIQGFPLGTYTNKGQVIFDPLGPQEEAHIQKNMEKRRFLTVDNARSNTIGEILRYLMINEESMDEMVKFANAPVNNNYHAKEIKRRENITIKRRRATNGAVIRNYLNEDTIEDLIEKHKNYLYEAHTKHGRNEEGLRKVLNRKNITKRNEKVEENRRSRARKTSEREKEKAELKELENYIAKLYNESKRASGARAKYLEDESDYLEDKLDSLRRNYYNVLDFSNNENTNNTSNYRYWTLWKNKTQKVKNMSPIEFERYIRSKRGPEEKQLAYQGKMIGNFFGSNNV